MPDRRHVLRGLAGAGITLAFAAPAAAGKRRGLCQGCGGKKKCGRALQCVNGRCVDKSDPIVCGDAYLACPSNKRVFCNGTGGTAQCCNGPGKGCSAASLICPS